MTPDQEMTLSILQAMGYRPQSPERIPFSRGAVSVIMAGHRIQEVALRIEPDGTYSALGYEAAA